MKCVLYIFASIYLVSLLSCSSDTDLPTIVTNPDDTSEMMEENLIEAPDFSLESLDGQGLSLTQFKDKALVIFFFGHNCPPCISAGPSIESDLHQEFKSNDDFAMIGIDVWDGSSNQVETFKDKSTATYSLGLKGSDVVRSFNSGRDRLVVVNKEGQIAFNGRSVAKNDIGQVKDLLNLILN